MRKPRLYHSLLSREAPGQPWCIEFGDYDKSVVKAERDDYRQRGFEPHKAMNLKIITTGETQAAIVAAVAELNGATPCPATASSTPACSSASTAAPSTS
jgi:hypothetical protein